MIEKAGRFIVHSHDFHRHALNVLQETDSSTIVAAAMASAAT